jgi:hypothetical protein
MGITGSLVLALVSVILATILLYAHKQLRKDGNLNTTVFTGAVGFYGGTLICLINAGLKYFA